MLLKAIYAQLIALCLTALWLAISKRRSQLDSFLKILTITLLLLGLWLGGVWVYPPLYGLIIIGLIFLVLTRVHLRKLVSETASWQTLISNFPVLVLIPIGSFLLWQGLLGRLAPKGESIALAPPFKEAQGICVLSGGVSPLLNFHIFPSDKPRDSAQTYGLDFIKLDPSGFRTRTGHTLNPKPKSAEHYAIFDVPVYAPCEGLVSEYENNLPDLPIGASDKTNTGGNGVVLQCSQYHVHMHHMKRGSVLPQLGETVKIWQKIGTIGNSGNTIEPHLHLHAETVVEPGNTNKHGRPVHMEFNGRFMARGDCF